MGTGCNLIHFLFFFSINFISLKAPKEKHVIKVAQREKSICIENCFTLNSELIRTPDNAQSSGSLPCTDRGAVEVFGN